MMIFVNVVDIIAAAFGFLLLAFVLWHGWRVRRHEACCKHEHYYETGACDAVCSDCGKNLGFIGSLNG
jgi:hypothetical protein